MKKMIKKLVAVMVMATVISTAVFAKDGDLHWNEDTKTHYKEVTQNGVVYLQNHITGELIEKTPIKRGAIFDFRKVGDIHTVSVILKDGVSMVSAEELAKVMGLWYEKCDSYIQFSAYTKMSELRIGEYPDLYPTNILRITTKDTVLTKKNEYEAETSQTEIVEGRQGSGRFFTEKKGKLKAPIQIINEKIYLPAREVINLINEQETQITCDEARKTITFSQMREWYMLKE